MKDSKKIYALGFFDGVHLGHQALLAECVRLSREMGAIPAAITFDQHPQALLTAHPPLLLTGIRERQQLLADHGIEQIRVFPVTKEVMSTTWQDFLHLLREAGAAGFVCGEDFRFGHRGEGDSLKLRAYCEAENIPCVIVPEQQLDGIRISSTHIRKLLEEGNTETAAKFLGHPHILTGNVTPGRQVGRTIGIPTANLLIEDGIVVPKLGVYACHVTIDGKKWPAVTNIGSRPTVGGHQVRAESWILGFEGDLYGRTLTLEFRKFLRPEQRFDSLEQLQKQIRSDAGKAAELLGES